VQADYRIQRPRFHLCEESGVPFRSKVSILVRLEMGNDSGRLLGFETRARNHFIVLTVRAPHDKLTNLTLPAIMAIVSINSYGPNCRSRREISGAEGR
jgi:hypothetical protein